MSRRDEVLACHAAGLTATEAARKLGLPRGSVRHHWPRAGDAPALPDPAPEAGGPSMPEPFHESYEPFTVDGGPVGLLSDPHIPYHDMATIKGWVDECVRMAVKTIFLNGDVLDFYQLSDFMRDPAMPRMREEILKGRQFLEYLRSRFPRARIVYKEGNHDERLERYLANLAPELLGLEDLELESLLRARDFGVEWVKDKRVVMCGKLPVVHGHEYRGGGGVMPARWLYLRTGESTLCFPAGTTVLARDGVRNIETIRAGDEVLTHEGNWKPVVRTQRRMAERTVTLKGHGHPRLTTTPEHPFQTRAGIWNSNGMRRGFGPTTWTPAAETEGLYWSTPTEFPAMPVPVVERINNIEKHVAVSEQLMWLAGRWLGDGWTSRGKVNICCGHHEADYLQHRLAEVPGITVRMGRSLSGSVADICRTSLARWLNIHFGSGAANKTVPAWALGMPKPYRESLLNGYLSADGHRPSAHGSPDWECCTVSRKLAIGVKLLAQSLGYSTTLYHESRSGGGIIQGRIVNQYDRWRVKGVKEFKRWSSAAREGGHQWGRVKKITDGGPQEVFNLTVEGDSSYIADGIVVHNCGHFHQPSFYSFRTITGKEVGTWSVGCACHLTPKYARLNQWARGWAVIELAKDGGYHVHNRRLLKDGRAV